MTDTTNQIVIYEAADGRTQLEVKLENETVWLNQAQMAALFGRDRDTVSEHIQNVFREKELERETTTRKFRAVQREGQRMIERTVDFYNLDVIISVGYRVKSLRGTQFRIWATRTLREHLVRGYTVNESRLKQIPVEHLKELESAIALLDSARQRTLSQSETAGLLDVITNYARTWLLLERYDKDQLASGGTQKTVGTPLDTTKAREAIAKLKAKLIAKKQAMDIFGRERGDAFVSILGNVEQTFGGQPLYPTLEEKAAHLLYFLVKDHPFTDGNKRIGAFLFIVYLAQNRFLTNKRGERKLNDNALAALTLLIAESDPKRKDTMIALVVSMLRNKL